MAPQVSYACSTSYSQSNLKDDVNLTVTINSRYLHWDETLKLNVTITNSTSGGLILNSTIFLNITTVREFYYIIIKTWPYSLECDSYEASSGFLERSIVIQHIPTLNPYVLTAHYVNDSDDSLNVSFPVYILSVRSGFIPFVTFEHFILFYFGLLLFCGSVIGYITYKDKKSSKEITELIEGLVSKEKRSTESTENKMQEK